MTVPTATTQAKSSKAGSAIDIISQSGIFDQCEPPPPGDGGDGASGGAPGGGTTPEPTSADMRGAVQRPDLADAVARLRGSVTWVWW